MIKENRMMCPGPVPGMKANNEFPRTFIECTSQQARDSISIHNAVLYEQTLPAYSLNLTFALIIEKPLFHSVLCPSVFDPEMLCCDLTVRRLLHRFSGRCLQGF